MDYGTLKTTLTSYLHRSDLESLIPTFVILAQARMSHDLRDTLFLSVATTTLSVTANDKDVTLPPDFMGIKSLRVPYAGGVRELQQQSLAQNGQVFGQKAGSPDTPYYYALASLSSIELAPIPVADETLTMVYRQQIANFSELVPTATDTILTRFPNLYIYAALLEAMPYTVNDKRIGTWGSMYESQLDRAKAASQDAEWGESPKQIKSLGMETP